MRPTTNDLGEFLRSSRSRLAPAEAGLISGGGGGRRVAGLRREEVAVLAGVSADYYARLEQGRERNPSAQVIDAVGRAMQLDADALGHLYRLAGLAPTTAPRDSMGGARDEVHPSLLQLLESFPNAAAYVLSPSFDVLATNAAADALLAPFAGTRNMVEVLFAHPAARIVFSQWDAVSGATVRALRLNAGYYPDDPQIGAIVERFLPASPEFAAAWHDRAVGSLSRAFKVFEHPELGRIELTYQTFDVRDAPGQQLLVGTPEPGTASAASIAILAGLTPSADPAPRTDPAPRAGLTPRN